MKNIIGIFSHSIRKKSIGLIFLYVLVHEVYTLKVNPIEVNVLGFIFGTFSIFFGMYLIVNLRGVELKGSRSGEVGVWGYIWRYYVITGFSLIVSIYFFKIVFGVPLPPYKSTLINLAVYTITMLLMPIFTWLFFSKDRKSQLQWVVSLFRGY
jgi:hypothetical protein